MLKRRVEQYERRLILSALAAANWSQRRAARALGVLPTTLHEKMKRLGVSGRPDGSALEAQEDELPEERILEEFRWHGRVEAGRMLEITGINGTLRAEMGDVDEVDLVAYKRGAPASRRSVVVRVSASRRGIAVVAETLEGRPVGSEVTVDVVVRVPVGVRLLTRLPAGRLDTHGVHGVLELRAREEVAAPESDGAGVSAPTGRIAREPTMAAAASKILSPARPAIA
jgi:hypothetical protein